MSVDDSGVIGLALMERKPRYPYEAALTTALLVSMCVVRFNGWLDVLFIALSVGATAYLTVRHQARRRLWLRGVESYRQLTGRLPWA
jgi:hypothetical protein